MEPKTQESFSLISLKQSLEKGKQMCVQGGSEIVVKGVPSKEVCPAPDRKIIKIVVAVTSNLLI